MRLIEMLLMAICCLKISQLQCKLRKKHGLQQTLKYTFAFLVAYYMEGRDSAQLIYRWTKSVDPSLKKGPWTSREDAVSSVL